MQNDCLLLHSCLSYNVETYEYVRCQLDINQAGVPVIVLSKRKAFTKGTTIRDRGIHLCIYINKDNPVDRKTRHYTGSGSSVKKSTLTTDSGGP